VAPHYRWHRYYGGPVIRWNRWPVERWTGGTGGTGGTVKPVTGEPVAGGPVPPVHC
jgi:hypothetical protein